jgi:integrase
MPRRGKRYGGITNEVFASVIRAYLSSPKFQGLSPETQRSYRRTLLLAECPDGLGSVPVEEMRPALVQAFLDGISDRPAAQQKAKRVLAALERWAIVRDLLPRQITTGTEAPGSNGGHVPWTDEQVLHAETHAAPHLSRAITLAANTGQRGSDLCMMRWTAIETINGRPGINVVQKKTGLQIWVPFTQALIAVMATWERRPGFILTRPDGTPFNRPALTNAWTEERRRPELTELAGLTLHGLRGAAVVRLRRAGVTVPQICDVVGMSPQMVARYCRFSDQRENALAAMNTLESKNTPAKILIFPD